ncbi:MAG: hypothetical protein KJ587_02815 [Alphaproteobacteria bacterium]|nr:hypothetical protein [Alphaproteobacteria bacterium]
MRHFILSAAIVAAFLSVPAQAGELVKQEPAKQEPVRIEMDQDAKAFVFVIDDEPVAILDKTGMHVRDLVSTGTGVKNRTDEFQERLAVLGKKDEQ